MALLQYFTLKKKAKLLLLNPNGPLSLRVPSSGILSANACVSKLLESGTASDTHGSYTILDPAQRFEIGRKAAEIGTTDAIRYYANRYQSLPL